MTPRAFRRVLHARSASVEAPGRWGPRAARAAGALLVLLVATCAPLPRVERPVPPSPVAALSSIEQEIHDRVNAHRRSRGLPALRVDPLLISLARDHSERMARGERPFGHDGFPQRSHTITAAGMFRRVSENVAMNNHPPEHVARNALSGWLGSPGHLRNIEAGVHLTGVGVARGPAGDHYITQLFAATVAGAD